MDMPYGNARRQEVLKVAEQAVEWLMAVEDNERGQFPALAEWLTESPLHVQMFLHMASLDRLTDSFSAEQRREVWAALEAETQTNVVALQTASAGAMNSGEPAPARGAKSAWLPLSFAATVLAGIGAAWWLSYGSSTQTHTFTTTVGEQRSISLSDGSVLHLNADSRVEVRYTDVERGLRLVNGEALFKVHADPARPFRVQVEEATVQALGTQFNIYRRQEQTTVAVIEGVVQVSSAKSAAGAAPQKLTAGEGVVLASGGGIERRETLDPAQVTAWRQRRLIFRWAPLQTIVNEFNRYNTSPRIRIESPALGERRYTAVFDADAPMELLKFLQRDEGISVLERENELVIQSR